MNQPLLGMYVHMHWGYGYPYAARTWTLADWRHYLGGLQGLGYNLVQIWPMLETMPPDLTVGDHEHLETLAAVIDVAHEEFGMTVYIGTSANFLGTDAAAQYAFKERPFFAASRNIDPGDPAARNALMERRRELIGPLKKADGFWIIDSDPGGFKDSTCDEFIQLLRDYRALLDDLREGIELQYWMWFGWGYGRIKTYWDDVLSQVKNTDLEPFGLLACNTEHFDAIERHGLRERTLYFPYGAVEFEPSFPLTNWQPDTLRDEVGKIAQERYPRGIMANAQNHCLQLPHTCLFSHLAGENARETVDLAAFADVLLPGCGDSIAGAWHALGSDDAGAAESALRDLPDDAPEAGSGPLAGLLLGSPERFMEDLRCQLAFTAAVRKVRDALEAGSAWGPPLKAVSVCLRAWADRHQFTDHYGGPFRLLLHPIVEQCCKDARTPEGRHMKALLDGFEELDLHGRFTEFLTALEAFAI